MIQTILQIKYVRAQLVEWLLWYDELGCAAVDDAVGLLAHLPLVAIELNLSRVQRPVRVPHGLEPGEIWRVIPVGKILTAPLRPQIQVA